MPRFIVELASLTSLFLCCCSAQAQLPRVPGSLTTDTAESQLERADQRLLPLPSGKPNVLQQIELLERLSNLASNAEKPPSQLTDSQLKMLDSAMNSFRNESGQLELPSLDMLPPGMLGNLLSDPAQRQQARRLLEQYARQRNLGVPGSQPNLPRLPGSPTDGQKPSSSEPNAATSPFRPQANDGRRQTTNPTTPGTNRLDAGGTNAIAPQSRDSTASSNRPPLTPERMKAVQELINNLRKIDEAQQKSQAADDRIASKNPAANSRSGDRNANSTSRNTDARSQRRLQSGQQPSPSQNGSRPGRLQPPYDRNRDNQPFPMAPPVPNTFPPMPAIGESDDPQSRRDGNPSSNLEQPSEEGFANQQSNRLDLGNIDPNDPFGEQRPSQLDPALLNDPFAKDPAAAEGGAGKSPQRGFRVKELAEQLQPSGSKSSTSRGSSLAPGRNAAAGNSTNETSRSPTNSWAQSWRGLINKALKEQGHDTDSAKRLLADTASQLRGLNPGASRSETDAANSANLSDPNQATQPSAGGSGQRNAQVSSSPANSGPGGGNASSGASQWGGLIREIWSSISAPPVVAGTSTPPSNTFGSARTSTDAIAGIFNGRVATVLLVALILLVAIYWLARQRLITTDDAQEAQNRWAREALTYGLKTRADVVRAFHLFVRRTSQPVAAWWNHRHVERQLSAATPQLSVALNELAGVYEQARYLPPDVELNEQQLERVRVALKQCDDRNVKRTSTKNSDKPTTT